MLNVILLLVIALPIAWLASEFQSRRGLRIGFGVATIMMAYGVAWMVGSMERWNYNIWYGAASKDLVDNTIAELEQGNADRVLRELRVLQQKLQPTYETRADYDRLVAQYANAISDSPTLSERNRPRQPENRTED